jgi:8-oxo-dGTP diphosphatase
MEFGTRIQAVSYRKRDAVYAVIMDKSNMKVAVMIQNGKGFLPGGGVNSSEDHVHCLKRECIEETGYTLKIGHFIGNAIQYFQSRQDEYIMNNGYFYAGTFGEYIKSPIEDDHQLVWLELMAAEKILFHSSHVWAVNRAYAHKSCASLINPAHRT